MTDQPAPTTPAPPNQTTVMRGVLVDKSRVTITQQIAWADGPSHAAYTLIAVQLGDPREDAEPVSTRHTLIVGQTAEVVHAYDSGLLILANKSKNPVRVAGTAIVIPAMSDDVQLSGNTKQSVSLFVDGPIQLIGDGVVQITHLPA